MTIEDRFTMLTETCFDDRKSAMEEAQKIRAASADSEILINVDESPYGGYRLRIVPLDIALDMAESLPFFFSRK